MADPKQREVAAPMVRVRYLHPVVRNEILYPAGAFEEDVLEASADSMAASGWAKRLQSGDLPGALPAPAPAPGAPGVAEVETPKSAGKSTPAAPTASKS